MARGRAGTPPDGLIERERALDEIEKILSADPQGTGVFF
jgi:hypothetical protein